MNRQEHLQWCKNRALEYLNHNDIENAFNSFMSDMTKHTETAEHPALHLGLMLRMNGNISTSEEMRKWIEGFN